jgi:hypothetical protein
MKSGQIGGGQGTSVCGFAYFYFLLKQTIKVSVPLYCKDASCNIREVSKLQATLVQKRGYTGTGGWPEVDIHDCHVAMDKERTARARARARASSIGNEALECFTTMMRSIS